MEAIGRLAGGIAHGFNNVLSVIFATPTSSARTSPPASRCAPTSTRSTPPCPAADLTRQLLAFSRRQALAVEPLDLAQVVAGAQKLLRWLVGEQVLLDLAVNARDAMPRGGELTVETKPVELDAHYARLHLDVTSGPYARSSTARPDLGPPGRVSNPGPRPRRRPRDLESCGMRLLLLIALIAPAACGAPRPTPTPAPAPTVCTPRDPCWPSAAQWRALAGSLTGELVTPSQPAPSRDPFWLQTQAGATQSRGWLDAWTAAPSAYAIAAANAADIAKGVAFARTHRLRLVIKGTGHDYLGRSSAPDSLLIWTHALRDITVDDAFVPHGCAAPPTPAVTVGAGTRWLEAYQVVTGQHRRYVQGGGCTSVGVAGGFLQGGGFGSFSKKFGIAASNLLEAQVVTADGALVTANACQHADLFWALRGGGGGTFGVVTKVTLRTHELPATIGGAFGTITAPNEAALRDVTAELVTLYRTRLANEHWGEQLTWQPDNTIRVSMLFQGLTTEEANAAWEPLRTWGAAHGVTVAVQANAFPGHALWDFDFLTRAGVKLGGKPALWWWGDNEDEVGAFWAAYQSRWLPLALFDQPRELAATLVAASRAWPVTLHFNKGQAGAAPDAFARGRQTAINPAVFDAAALVIVAADDPAYATDRPAAERARAKVAHAMAPIRAATPTSGAYVNEADYFEPDWQRAFWGANYARLLAIKRTYDPDGLFRCHHCVGSEARAP